jgi:hypothetical protein
MLVASDFRVYLTLVQRLQTIGAQTLFSIEMVNGLEIRQLYVLYVLYIWRFSHTVKSTCKYDTQDGLEMNLESPSHREGKIVLLRQQPSSPQAVTLSIPFLSWNYSSSTQKIFSSYSTVISD